MKLPVLLCLLLGVSACQTAYQRPNLAVPEQWQNQTTQAATLTTSDTWWEGFADPSLLNLLAQVRQHHPDLQSSLLTVYKAQLAAGLADSHARPSVSGTISTNASRATNQAADWAKSSASQLTIGYELDLWGRVAATQRAAQAQFMASRYDDQALRLLADSTAAGLYWEIASLKTRIDLAKSSLANADKILSISRAKLRSGAVSIQDTLQAEQNQLSQQNTLQSLQQDLLQQSNALALLLDQPLGNKLPHIPALALQVQMPSIQPGLPSTLLARRPDLQAAEARLRSQLAQVDQARAAMWPMFSLTGGMGTSSNILGQLLQNPVASLGASITLPFLQWRQQGLQIKSSEADYQLASIALRKALYSAYQEVDNGLNLRQQLIHNAQRQVTNLKLSQRNEAISQTRYQAGEVDLQTWLTASNSRYQAEEALVNLRLTQLKNLADLYKALGGGLD